MSTDPETTRIVRSWLDEGVTELPDRVLDAVIDQLPVTQQRRATWWPVRRLSTMNATLKLGVAAAVVAVAALVGINYFGTSNVGGPGLDGSTPTPQPTVVSEASPEPTAEPAPVGNLEAGETWNIALPEGPMTVSVTMPAAGWSGEGNGGVIVKGDADPPAGAGIITFVDPEYYVYGDPCRWSTTRPDTPATTVDELVAALSAQASRDASAPVDITLDGYAGKSITLNVPDDADLAACDEGKFASWGVIAEDAARYHQGAGQIDKLWIVDVDGRLVVIDTAYYAGTPQTVVDELDAIAESATFGD